MKKYLILAGVSLFIIACEKNVTVEVPKVEEGIVVEGRIEIDTFPIVFLSRTLPFFGEISANEIQSNTITGATVVVDDGFTIDTLVQIDPGYGIYFGSQMRGVEGRTYKLSVNAEGKTLTSITTIPHTIKLDSVWWKVNGNRDSLGFAWAHLTDPDTNGNCFQWYAKRINKYTYGKNNGRQKDSTFVAGPGSAFEDKFFNAKSFDFNFARGAFSFSEKEDDNNDERFYFKRGDTIVVKFCSIDRNTFEFWRTEETQVQNNGNPFGSPAPISGNIEGGLGIWGGYAASYDTIIAQ
jgi:hypothetical protein